MYTKILGLDNCYGCGVCAAVCPVDIIEFEPDGEGFFRPTVYRGDKCVNCGLCDGSCAALSHPLSDMRKTLAAWTGYSTDEHTRYVSSSGGAGYELAAKTIMDGGIFCGVRYTPASRGAEHYVARAAGELEQSAGSKYTQSDSAAGFREAFSASTTGGMIVGTPCQIASVEKYLSSRGRRGSFTLVDFFCHGMPTPRLWHKYLDDNASTLGMADRAGFRSKKYGWSDSWRIWGIRDGKEVYFSEHDDMFFKFYLSDYVNMMPCYSCPFRREHSAADIRLGDMWGGKYGDGKNGYTAMIAFSEKGRRTIESNDKISVCAVSPDSAAKWQIKRDQPVPSPRGKLIAALAEEKNLGDIYGKYRLSLYLWRLRFRIKRRLRRLCGKALKK